MGNLYLIPKLFKTLTKIQDGVFTLDSLQNGPFQVDVPAKEVNQIYDEYNRDEDIIKRDFVGLEAKPKPAVCTLNDEFKPPTERPSVKLMIELGRSKPKYTKIWNPKSGLDFYPCHR